MVPAHHVLVRLLPVATGIDRAWDYRALDPPVNAGTRVLVDWWRGLNSDRRLHSVATNRPAPLKRTREDLVGPQFTDDATTSNAAHGPYYTDQSIHQLEIEQVFSREWGYLCHAGQIPKPGDYLVSEIGGESLYVIRGRDETVRAFFNVCQHRGHELLQGQGNVPNVVVCPYHSWSYGMEGDLRGAPKMRLVSDFDKSEVTLTPVRVEVIGGFVFANLDDDAPSLREAAPAFETILLSMIAESNQLKLVRQWEYDIAANWKIVTENFLEAYHVEFSGPAHQALANIIDVDTYRFEISGRTIEYTAKGGDPSVLPYEVNSNDAFTNSRGAPFHQVFLYPNMTFSVFPGTNLLFVFNIRPNGPDRCAEEITFFALDPEISEASAMAEAYVSQQLNHEDVALVEGVQRGIRSRGYRPGRLMVDPEQSEGWSEHFVHHFNQLNLAALNRPPNSELYDA